MDIALLHDLELIERDALADVYSAAALSTPEASVGVLDTDRVTFLSAEGGRAMFNRALYLGCSRLDTAGLDHVLRAAPFRQRWMLSIPSWIESPSIETLQTRGLQPAYGWMKFWRRAEEVPVTACALAVRPLEREDGFIFAELMASEFRTPPALRGGLAALPRRFGWHCFGAFDGPRLLAAAASFLRGDAAWFGFAATHPEARRRGAQTALLQRRINAAVEGGARTLVIETGERAPGRPDQSYRNILRAGFQEAYLRPNFERAAP